jgi:hypothetical protein
LHSFETQGGQYVSFPFQQDQLDAGIGPFTDAEFAVAMRGIVGRESKDVWVEPSKRARENGAVSTSISLATSLLTTPSTLLSAIPLAGSLVSSSSNTHAPSKLSNEKIVVEATDKSSSPITDSTEITPIAIPQQEDKGGGALSTTTATSDTTEKASTNSFEAADCHLGIGSKYGLLQRGVLRTNCIDCLDRTNVGQFCYAKTLLHRQVRALGISLTSSSLTTFMMLSMELWSRHGDEMAQQYGGSGAMHKVDEKAPSDGADGGSQNKQREFVLTDGAQNALVAVQRYYSNVSLDAEKQQALDLLLGIFEPKKGGGPALWDLDLRPSNMRAAASTKNKTQWSEWQAQQHDRKLGGRPNALVCKPLLLTSTSNFFDTSFLSRHTLSSFTEIFATRGKGATAISATQVSGFSYYPPRIRLPSQQVYSSSTPNYTPPFASALLSDDNESLYEVTFPNDYTHETIEMYKENANTLHFLDISQGETVFQYEARKMYEKNLALLLQEEGPQSMSLPLPEEIKSSKNPSSSSVSTTKASYTLALDHVNTSWLAQENESFPPSYNKVPNKEGEEKSVNSSTKAQLEPSLSKFPTFGKRAGDRKEPQLLRAKDEIIDDEGNHIFCLVIC